MATPSTKPTQLSILCMMCKEECDGEPIPHQGKNLIGTPLLLLICKKHAADARARGYTMEPLTPSGPVPPFIRVEVSCTSPM